MGPPWARYYKCIEISVLTAPLQQGEPPAPVKKPGEIEELTQVPKSQLLYQLTCIVYFSTWTRARASASMSLMTIPTNTASPGSLA